MQFVENEKEQNKQQFPVGTLVYYGPDDQTVTKITAGVVASRNSPVVTKSWYGDNVTTNPVVIGELGRFFQERGVHKVIMTTGIAGCPHEEGIDYPVGEECPFCPFWSNSKQPSQDN
jgi:hypothetical protein